MASSAGIKSQDTKEIDLESLVSDFVNQEQKLWEQLLDNQSKSEADDMKTTEDLHKAIAEAKEEGQLLQQSMMKRKEAIGKYVSGLGLKENK